MPNDNSEFKNDWTLMFFFASDNTLAPLLVSQLKDIKYAGFQEHTEVLVYFDPLEKDRPTKIYNVNSKRKAYALEQWQNNKGKSKSMIKVLASSSKSSWYSPDKRYFANEGRQFHTFSNNQQTLSASPFLSPAMAMSSSVLFSLQYSFQLACSAVHFLKRP